MPATISLHPPLVSRSTLPSFIASKRTVYSALSPRSNSLAIFASTTQEDPPKTNAFPDETSIFFAQCDRVLEANAQLFTESYVTFKMLQALAFQQEQDGILLASAKNVEFCYRTLSLYADHLQDHIDRLGARTPFNEKLYCHFVDVYSTLALFQTVYTTATGNTDGLVGEELMDWLNNNFVAPRTEEGHALNKHPKPWLDENFWPYLTKCVIRGIAKSAQHFLSRLSTHPSSSLRRLSKALIDVLARHPRSTSFSTETEFNIAHSRWKQQVASLRNDVDMLQDWEGTEDGAADAEGKWRDGIENICRILEGDKQALFDACTLGWREAMGVYGLWIDPRLTRQDLAVILTDVQDKLPIDNKKLDETVHAAIFTDDVKQTATLISEWDPWLCAHLTDMLDKLGEINQKDHRSETLDLTLRSIYLMNYAEHLHSDPSLWELTLEYTAACGAEGKDCLAELVMRVPIDFESVSLANRNDKEKLAETDEMIQTGAEGIEVGDEAKQWDRWTEKVEKLITVCKDYGLEDVICSLCKSVARMLSRRGQYGLAVQYSILGRDGRGVGRIADQLLEEYLIHGPETFCAQVASIPHQYLIPSSNSAIPGDVFASRLEFLARYADYHEMCKRGEKRQAAKLLVALFEGGMMPRWWWGILLLDIGGMLEDDELLISMDDTYELLRHLEEIFIRTEQGSGADYLSALRKMIGDGSDENDALKQLEVVRLTLARYLARCSTKPASTWTAFH